MDSQVTPGNHVLAIDMAACIRCGNCVTACRETHIDGISRFSWERLRGHDDLIPQVRLSSSCQHCEFALCARVCPTNAIERDPDSGGVFIDYEKCIRCGRCGNPEQGCPYGSIQIVPATEVAANGRSHHGEHGASRRNSLGSKLLRAFSVFSVPSVMKATAEAHAESPRTGKHYPVKCDLCHGLPFEACVHHCPTGAVFRFDGQQHLEGPLVQLMEQARSYPEAPWPLRLRAAFRTPPQAKRPAVLELSLGEQVDGASVLFYRPEPGVDDLVANVFLTVPGVNVGGGPTRQLRLSVDGGEATAEYQMTAPSPGARSLQLSLYQGGFYVGTVPVAAEWE
jgi:Fe-S-cluster-containing hydrogenase component 2